MLIWHLFFFVFFRNHIFDLKARSKREAHRKVATISDPDDAARGVAPIRQFVLEKNHFFIDYKLF
jgi:hypothetical protein